MLGSLRSAWNLEKPRFKRRGKSHWSIRNDVLNSWLMSARAVGRALAVFGWSVLPFLLIQAVVGLPPARGRQLPRALRHAAPDAPAPTTAATSGCCPSHSWNSNNIASNVLLYHLQRHSDHHANPTRRYQTLRDFEESPALPTGYAGMILLALVPPLWRRVMDPRVLAHMGGDLSRANLRPRSATGSWRATRPPDR